MSSGFIYSTEGVTFFFVILFIVFCCGLLRGLKQYCNKNLASVESQPPDSILVTHIRLQQAAAEARREDSVSSVFPSGPPSPPPYSVVSNDTSIIANMPPPSYDEVLKQMHVTPKSTVTESAPS